MTQKINNPVVLQTLSGTVRVAVEQMTERMQRMQGLEKAFDVDDQVKALVSEAAMTLEVAIQQMESIQAQFDLLVEEGGSTTRWVPKVGDNVEIVDGGRYQGLLGQVSHVVGPIEGSVDYVIVDFGRGYNEEFSVNSVRAAGR